MSPLEIFNARFFRNPDEDDLDQPIAQFHCVNSYGDKLNGWSYQGITRELPHFLKEGGIKVNGITIRFRGESKLVMPEYHRYFYFAYGAWKSNLGTGGNTFTVGYGNHPAYILLQRYTVPVINLYSESTVALSELRYAVIQE